MNIQNIEYDEYKILSSSTPLALWDCLHDAELRSIQKEAFQGSSRTIPEYEEVGRVRASYTSIRGGRRGSAFNNSYAQNNNL
jgi:hypothetical protein